MHIQNNISLKSYNTFGIDVYAKRFIEVTSLYELKELIRDESDFFVLSGGSNVLLTKDIKELVIHLNIKGISIDKHDNSNTVHITVNAGENWHDFVRWCISQDYGGVENLSLIPGNVGTSPIQNIGAYGVEVKDVITKINALEIRSGQLVTFSNDDCEFGYRNSIFKSSKKGQYIIISVSFALTKTSHSVNTSYGAIKNELALMNVADPTIEDVSNAVISIRQSKLPDPNKIGNSGSFFKNPVISSEQYTQLHLRYPDMPCYVLSDTERKVPAAWLIEKCGFKGKRYGNFGVHNKQALVLVNHGGASGQDIYNLAQRIQEKIKQTFSIDLEIEVNVV